MRTSRRSTSGAEVVGGLVLSLVLILLIVTLPIGCSAYFGIGAFGPTHEVEATVDRLYVDNQGDAGSAYMVGTDKGVFEVENGIFLGMWNADEIYSQLQQGKRYRITTEGNRVVGMFFQQYPKITAVQSVE